MNLFITRQGFYCWLLIMEGNVYNIAGLAPVEITCPEDMKTNLTEHIEREAPLKCPEEYYYDPDEREWARQGMVEAQAYFDRFVQQLLGAVRSWRQLLRQIHQPCWRSGRWKSLT